MSGAPLPSPPASLEDLRRAVAAVLDLAPSTLEDDDDLIDVGLDSIRIMAFSESWSASGPEIAFLDLIEAPTLAEWWGIVEAARVG